MIIQIVPKYTNYLILGLKGPSSHTTSRCRRPKPQLHRTARGNGCRSCRRWPWHPLGQPLCRAPPVRDRSLHRIDSGRDWIDPPLRTGPAKRLASQGAFLIVGPDLQRDWDHGTPKTEVVQNWQQSSLQHNATVHVSNFSKFTNSSDIYIWYQSWRVMDGSA